VACPQTTTSPARMMLEKSGAAEVGVSLIAFA
jgi:hypothetical protein